MYRNPKVTAASSAVGLTTMLVMIFVVNVGWPWRIVFGSIAVLLAVKVAVAWRADRSNVSHVEQVLRRLAFVGDRG